MKVFYIKLLIFQTILFTLLWMIFYFNGLTNNGKLIWKPMVVIFYIISVIITFIIPMIKELKSK